MDVYDFTPVQYPADDITAVGRLLHFNFHDIDENVLSSMFLGHDDPTMIRSCGTCQALSTQTVPQMIKGFLSQEQKF